jgi:1-deoxyxylulose-5-phosphate synthase
MGSKDRNGRISNPLCPRFGSRRQFVVGVSGLVGSLACGESGQRSGVAGAGGAPSGGGSIGQSGGSSGQSGGASTSAGANTGGAGAGGSALGHSGANAAGGMGATLHKAASDRVLLGSTGIVASRLAMGSGSHSNDQARLGVDGFARLLTYGYEQGLNFFETADAYGAHPHVAEAIRRVGRNNVVILTKTRAETAAGVEADLARFREELGIDTIDIVLLHLKTSSRWTSECEGAMEALAEAKQAGAIRAHGVSCHSLEALRLAAKTPWVDVDLARINPAGLHMDSAPSTVIPVLREMKAAGKAVIGMKILGEGQLANQLDMAVKHAVDLDALDAFTIGFTNQGHLDQVVQKIVAG